MSSPTTPIDSSGALVVRRVAVLGIAGVALALTLAACGGSSGANPAPSSTAAATGSSSAAAGGGGPAGPAASGLVASVSGSTLQVQSQQNGQVAVAWTGSTTFTHAVTESVGSLKAGYCVVAVAPTGTAAGATSFTASTVEVSSSSGGTCSVGGGGAAGGGAGGQRPSGFPGGGNGQRPSGAPSGAAGRAGSIAAGKLTSVSGSTVVIDAQQRTPGSTAATTKSVTVTVGSATAITTQASTTSSSVQVGKCVAAQGTSDSSGTVTATSIQITNAANGQCTAAGGFGGGGSRG